MSPSEWGPYWPLHLKLYTSPQCSFPCPLFSSDTYLQPTCHVFYLLMSWVTHQEANSVKTGLLILSVHCCISSTQIAPASGNCSVSISQMHELWDLQTEIISKCLLSSCKFLLQLYFKVKWFHKPCHLEDLCLLVALVCSLLLTLQKQQVASLQLS